MATRNLTRQFIEIRSSSFAHGSVGKKDAFLVPSDDGSLLQNDSSASTFKQMKETLPPIWVDTIEQVEEDISKIRQQVKELNSLHNKRLMVNFETDEQEQERIIEDKTVEITHLFRHAEGVLKKFGNANAQKSSEAETMVRNNIQRSVAKKLQGLSVQFRGMQKEYLTKLRAQKSGSEWGMFDSSAKADSTSEPAFVDHGFNSDQLRIVDDTERLVNERDEEITNIAKSIEELAAIFKELSAMVIDQGTILDRIDYNMEMTVEYAKEGIQELVKAEEHQKNSLSVKCIIFLCVLIFIMVVILIMKHKK